MQPVTIVKNPLFIKPKIQFLKANHNMIATPIGTQWVVYKAKDTIFES